MSTRSQNWTRCLILLVVTMACRLQAEEVVFDFEASSGKPVFKTLSEQETLNPTPAVRASGSRAALLIFPAWKKGMTVKRSITLYPKKKNWTGVRWFSMELFNPSATAVELLCFVVDAKHKDYHKGARFRIQVNPYSTKKCVWPVKWKEKNDTSKIDRIHIYCEKKDGKKRELIVDNIAFSTQKAKPSSEPSPLMKRTTNAHRQTEVENLLTEAIQEAKAKQIALPFLQVLQRDAEEVRREMVKAIAIPGAEVYFDEYAAPVRKKRKRDKLYAHERVDVLKKCAERLSQEQVLPLYHAQNILRSVKRYVGLQKDLSTYRKLGKPEEDVLVGFSTGTYKVMPKHVPVDLNYKSSHTVRMARREMECFQLSVVPTEKPLGQVRVETSDLKGPDGAILPRSQIECDLVGYTQTRKLCDYGGDYVGWWPDPLLPIRRGVPVAVVDAQSWWIRIWCPEKQKPGMYNGTLTVHAADRQPISFEFRVQVWDFAMPTHTPIPTAVTTLHNNWEECAEIMGSKERWLKTMRFRWADTLGKYYMTPDSLYRPAAPFPEKWSSVDFELLQYMKSKGTLGTFNLAYLWGDKEKDIEQVRHNYEKAKELGMLDLAYAYGWDERGRDYTERIEKVCSAFDKKFPEVLTLTTTPWFTHKKTKEPLTPSLDACCPINAGYAPDIAEYRRRRGEVRTWWYTCVWPPHPWPNFFIEYQPYDMRAFTGLLQIGNQPDGFLYYHTIIFGPNTGLDFAEGAYTSWNPLNFIGTHGDGRWWYFDKEGSLVPSMVVENFRDGLEDTAYHMILKHKLRESIRSMNGYVKLDRRGKRVSAYTSGDGKQWHLMSSQEIELGREAYLGFAVTAHSNKRTTKVVFDKLAVRGQHSRTFKTLDVGDVGIPSTHTVTNGTHTIEAAGSDIWGKSDSFSFTYVKLDGDGSIQARIKDLPLYSHNWSNCGLMVRRDLKPNSSFAMASMYPGHKYGLNTMVRDEMGLIYRSNTGADVEGAGSLPFTDWMKKADDALFKIKPYYWGLNGYTKDPEKLYEFRKTLGTLIESSPYKDGDPWTMHGWGAKGLKGVPR